MTLVMVLVAAAAAVGVVVWAWTLHVRQAARIDAIEGRVAHLLASLSLLTDTTEGGMRDLAAEVARVGAALATMQKPKARTVPGRTSTAGRRRPAATVAEEPFEDDDLLDGNDNGGPHAEVR